LSPGEDRARRDDEDRQAEVAEMAFEGSREKVGILAELWAFMRVRKKWWLGPIVLMLALLGLLVVFTQGSAVAPFIYTLF
jgi:membrane glycosyltransferase